MFLLTLSLSVLLFLVLTLIFEGTNRWNNLPSHIDSKEEWEGYDDSRKWYTRWRMYVKSWFAYDWKKPHWFGSLRRYPVTLFGVFGPGESRWENDFMAIRSTNNAVVWYFPPRNGFYVSRVQYWCDWSFVLNWPLGIFWHFKWGKRGVVQGYFGWKRDPDTWWAPVLFLGRGWK